MSLAVTLKPADVVAGRRVRFQTSNNGVLMAGGFCS